MASQPQGAGCSWPPSSRKPLGDQAERRRVPRYVSLRGKVKLIGSGIINNARLLAMIKPHTFRLNSPLEPWLTLPFEGEPV